MKIIARVVTSLVIILLLVFFLIIYFSPVTVQTSVFNKDTQIPECKDNMESILPLDDFRNYPCLGKDPSEPNVSLPARCVRTVCQDKLLGVSDVTAKHCVPLKQTNQHICTYDPSLDVVSKDIHTHGQWEGTLVDIMMKTLKANPQLVFLDLGCNIGVYTIAAASLHTQTYCVDANPENLRLVSKSISLGHLENYTTLIWNALSDSRGEVELKVIKDNAGASRIGDITKFKMTLLKLIKTNAILLDDLQSLLKGKEVFIKIDIEAHELFVLKGASDFFKNVNVRFIQMELLESETFHAVVDLLYLWGYMMFKDPSGKERLDRKDFQSRKWPGDVYFIKLAYLPDLSAQ